MNRTSIQKVAAAVLSFEARLIARAGASRERLEAISSAGLLGHALDIVT